MLRHSDGGGGGGVVGSETTGSLVCPGQPAGARDRREEERGEGRGEVCQQCAMTAGWLDSSQQVGPARSQHGAG